MCDTVYTVRPSADDAISGSQKVWDDLFQASDGILRVFAGTDDRDQGIVRWKYSADIENRGTVWELSEERREVLIITVDDPGSHACESSFDMFDNFIRFFVYYGDRSVYIEACCDQF